MDTNVLRSARLLWDYLASFSHDGPSDAIVVCCSYDLRVCDYACRLAERRGIRRIVFSGRSGNWTRHLWERPEAQVFKDRALELGFGPESVKIEEEATNLGENIAYSREILPDAEVVTFVTKPNTLLRVALTVPLRWSEIDFFVSGPDLAFPEDASSVVGIFGIISEMVGDIERILEYPSLGFQVPHDLPLEILEAYRALIAAGFTHHLLGDRSGLPGERFKARIEASKLPR